MVIAIDGPAGAGKSTVAQALAECLGMTYLDSGAMYRCVALSAIRTGIDFEDESGLAELARGLDISVGREGVRLNGEDVTEVVRAPEVSVAASRVSVHGSVRSAIVDRQRELIAGGDYVAEGRDIGTVVSPDAPLKVYLTASEGERARRRAAETGEPLESVSSDLASRDDRDRRREHGALRPAADATEVDTTGLEVGEVVERIVAIARERGLASR